MRLPKVPGAGALLAAFLFVFTTAAGAQTSDTRIPLFVLDAHAATVGLPQEQGWVPTLPPKTIYPGRNFGVAGGGSLYPLRFSQIAFGVGASMIYGKGTGETEVVTGTGSTATKTVTHVVHTGITSIVPQVSINFGKKLGWSYLSAGYGKSKVSSSAEATKSAVEIVVPDAWNVAVNFGGGARWFMKPHLGAGFDVRWVKLMNRGQTDVLPSAKRTQVWNISAGISIQ